MECPFCSPPDERVFLRHDQVVGLWDAFPVSPGHALLIPRRHIPTWFDATDADQIALIAAINETKARIEQLHHPDGYNIGINCGAAAGQTVFHLHVHVIPRYAGDVTDPRGGVRHVIADKANYLRPPSGAPSKARPPG
jgi:diadenosine tetraphosphate (Ap4A) HIT family hydrolase